MELIEAPQIFGDVELAGKHPIIDRIYEVRVIKVNEDKVAVVVEVGIWEGENILKVILTPLVPCWNIGVRGRNGGHGQVLWNICKKEINVCMQL